MLERVFKVSATSMHTWSFSDGYASIDDVPVKVKPSLHQVLSQVVDVMNLYFMHDLLYNTYISKFQAHDDPGPLWWSSDTSDAIFFGNIPLWYYIFGSVFNFHKVVQQHNIN